MKMKRHKNVVIGEGERLCLRHVDAVGVALYKLLLPEVRMLASLARRSAHVELTADEIHDTRIGLRRSAALLRFFAKELKVTSAALVRRKLQDLSATLGAARDFTVWNKLITKKKIAAEMEGIAGWPQFLSAEMRHERNAVSSLRKPGVQAQWQDASSALSRLVRAELRGIAPDSAAVIAVSKAMTRSGRKFVRQHEEMAANDPVKLHNYRRRMRRLRYIAEAFAPVLPRKLRKLTKRLHRAEARLGKLHDIDVALSRMSRIPHSVAQALSPVLARRRKKLLR